jgi:hypothetical protein
MKEDEMGGACNRHERDEKCIKPERKRPHGRPKRE